MDAFVAAYDPSLRTGKLTDSSNQVFDPRLWRRVGGRTADGHIEDVLRPPPGAAVREGTGRIVWSWYVVNGRAVDTRIGAKLLELREDEIGLEEVFLRVTRGETQ